MKIATHYVDDDGNEFAERLNHTDLMKKQYPVYIELPTWKKDIRGITRFKDLPKPAKILIKKIEELAETEVVMIGTGPDDIEKINLRKSK